MRRRATRPQTTSKEGLVSFPSAALAGLYPQRRTVITNLLLLANMHCASCGSITGTESESDVDIGNIKPNQCDGCDIQHYCNMKFQDAHRSRHQQECKKSRAAETRDNIASRSLATGTQ
eukprot:scaffold20884_cov150-Skeletonema_dohrnii-CCMP3373.AAC.13